MRETAVRNRVAPGRLATACGLLTLLAASPALAQLQVAVVTTTQRVLRDEPLGAQREVRLAAARCETRGFQLLLRSETPQTGIQIEPGELRGPGGATLPAAHAQLFREHQLELSVGSYRNKTFQPGWYPDPLIPVNHPLTGKRLQDARLEALPFDLPARQTHGFWIDVSVPADAADGVYRGTYRVTATGQAAVELPVTLTVWDFALPATPVFQTALGSPARQMRAYYQKRAKADRDPEPADWSAVDAQIAELLRQHRINATPPEDCLALEAQSDGGLLLPAAKVTQLRDFIDRYHVNAVNLPHPNRFVKDPAAQAERLKAWATAWDRAAAELDRPGTTLFIYLKDEPNDAEAYRYVQTWGRAIRQLRSAVKVLVVEQTWPQDPAWGDLYGAVDIWCPLFSLHKQESAAPRQAAGEVVWTYTALCQREPTPWWQIDFPLLNYRVPMWMAWHDRLRGILYWGGMSYWNQVDDPWTDPKTLDRRQGRKDPLYNGEGTLVYPGRAVGYDGIAPSLRLKALRDGIQDYEYLALLERRGQAAAAEKVVALVARSFFDWESDPQAAETARAKLAELIVAGPR